MAPSILPHSDPAVRGWRDRRSGDAGTVSQQALLPMVVRQTDVDYASSGRGVAKTLHEIYDMYNKSLKDGGKSQQGLKEVVASLILDQPE